MKVVLNPIEPNQPKREMTSEEIAAQERQLKLDLGPEPGEQSDSGPIETEEVQPGLPRPARTCAST